MQTQQLKRYETYLRSAKHSSENTIEAYMRDLRQFSAWLTPRGVKSFAPVTAEQAKEYVEYLGDCGKSASTVTRTLASLRCFYAYLWSAGKCDSNPFDAITPPHAEKKLPMVLTSDEINLLISQPKPVDFKGYRDRAILELLYAAGVRVSELIALDLSDVNLSAGFIRVGESGHERVIPIYHEAASAISDYLRCARQKIAIMPGETALFVNSGGTRMTRQGLWKMLKKYQSQTKIDKEITPQTFRHSLATHMLQNGADLDTVQEILGHTDKASTQLYAQMLMRGLRDAYDRFHPRAN